ncbi:MULTISPECIES: hypothetical protein [unclassified Streptomyces]|uniref:hypothetical protein n=1 Tax=unclassified Streptomyces TaxID=2593676 RepID=UPI000B8627E3|nr:MULTISPECIES: hypothetical protein [unclassified Streptomyces]
MRENPVVTARDAVLRTAGLPAVDLGTVVAEQDDPLVEMDLAIEALHDRLDAAQAATTLPDTPHGHEPLHTLLVRARLD